MEIIVQKFGGTSMGSIQNIRQVASIVKLKLESHSKIIVVVSAMAGFTDKIASFIEEIDSDNSQAADLALCAGEQVAVGLLTLTLTKLGVKARSWLGWEVPIYTDSNYGAALIESIDLTKIKHSFAKGLEVAVVAGFQGISKKEQLITTLGRGGSDITATAMAVVAQAQECEIYTDVCGMYTADPKVLSAAQLIPHLSYNNAIQVAKAGAKVLHPRAIAIAHEHAIKIIIKSTFEPQNPGTTVMSLENSIAVVTSIKEFLVNYRGLEFFVRKSSGFEGFIIKEVSRVSIVGLRITSSIIDEINRVINVPILQLITEEHSLSIIVDKENTQVTIENLHRNFIKVECET